MKRVAFVMQIVRGCEEEYEQRHKAIWPELYELLKSTGISEYSIFLHPLTGQLFGVFQVAQNSNLDDLPKQLVMKKWWNYMKDIMDTKDDESPVSIPLKEVFYLY